MRKVQKSYQLRALETGGKEVAVVVAAVVVLLVPGVAEEIVEF